MNFSEEVIAVAEARRQQAVSRQYHLLDMVSEAITRGEVDFDLLKEMRWYVESHLDHDPWKHLRSILARHGFGAPPHQR